MGDDRHRAPLGSSIENRRMPIALSSSGSMMVWPSANARADIALTFPDNRRSPKTPGAEALRPPHHRSL
jgi:hypothetical protein